MMHEDGETMRVCFLVFFLLPSVAAERKVIYPDGFRENLPFSPGILMGETLYVAGQTGSDPETGVFPETFEDETRMTFRRIGMVLREAGYGFGDVVDVKVYLTDIGDFRAMNAIFREMFPEAPPVRTTVQVASLVGKARIEITVIAAR